MVIIMLIPTMTKCSFGDSHNDKKEKDGSLRKESNSLDCIGIRLKQK